MDKRLNLTQIFTRRSFLASTSCLGAAITLGRSLRLPALRDLFPQDRRIAGQPIVDKGFASVRKIGNGVYATISDFSKGLETLSNGGFLVGQDAVLLIEGFRTPAGASFQYDVLRSVTKLPVRAAMDTHYHFDHSLGNAVYGANDIPIWAHAQAAARMVQNYGNLQGVDKSAQLEVLRTRVRDASSESERQRAQGDLNATTLLFQTIDAVIVSLPNRPLDPAKLPMTVDLGGMPVVLETHPGHTATDVIVRIPDQDIVFTGDLLFSRSYPATFDANISAWRATLEKFARFNKDTLFVPGHGPICGQEGIARLRAVFDDLAEHAGRMYKAGVPVEEAQKRYVVPERFKDFSIFAWSFCITPTMTKLYAEYKAGKS